MNRSAVGALALLLLTALLGAQEKSSRVKLRYLNIKRQYDEQFEEFQKAYTSARTDLQRRKALAEKYPDVDRFARRFLELARSAPKDATAVDALLWVVEHPTGQPTGKDPRSQALERLREDHVRSEKIGQLCTMLVSAPDSASLALLQAALEKSPHAPVKARACMSLALNLKFRARTLRRLKAEPKLAQELAPVWGKANVDALLAGDPDKMQAESEQLLRRVMLKYAKVKHPQHGDLKQMARVHLEALREPVAVGKPAPPIKGDDLDGKPLALSEQRGKVVLLDFWADGFGPCRKAYALERALVKRLAGKPFVLLGVNADGLKASAQKARKAKKLTWRSWWDGGGAGGPIATRWDVLQWPTLFLIDHTGVVRHVYLGWPEAKVLDEAVDALVGKAESAGKKG
jgi:thiol-disulfide isomerase/thioredoxin